MSFSTPTTPPPDSPLRPPAVAPTVQPAARTTKMHGGRVVAQSRTEPSATDFESISSADDYRTRASAEQGRRLPSSATQVELRGQSLNEPCGLHGATGRPIRTRCDQLARFGIAAPAAGRIRARSHPPGAAASSHDGTGHHWNGGEYSNPPLVHRRLSLRSSRSGARLPMLFSKISS